MIDFIYHYIKNYKNLLKLVKKKKKHLMARKPNKNPFKAFNLGSLSRSTRWIIKTTLKVNTVLKSHMIVHSNISGCWI